MTRKMRGLLQVGGPTLLAFSAGISLLVQVAVNARLRTGLASWSWAGLVSYLGGALTMAALLLVQRPAWPTATMRGGVPWWGWMGGLFGAVYIVLGIVSVQRLGAASTVALVVAGQMLASLVFDHFGLLGLAQHPASTPRLLGAAMLIGGVILIRG
jgi:transporter family-2 protein